MNASVSSIRAIRQFHSRNKLLFSLFSNKNALGLGKYSTQAILNNDKQTSILKPCNNTTFTINSKIHTTRNYLNKVNEKAVGDVEKHEFLAETKQLLNIVAKSLYSEKEVFIRELVSNASDAIEKLKYAHLTESSGAGGASPEAGSIPYEIRINASDIDNTLIIQDTGVGMTKSELIQFLGTIAHSGSKAFLEKYAKESTESNQRNIIGQFGVGFYSAFMVAEKVQVFSKSYKQNEKAHEWISTGDGSYEIREAEGVERGTKIILHLKKDCGEFAKVETIKDIIKKYSNFVGHPIYVNDDRINVIQALWLEDPKNITEDQHEDFYKFIGNPYDKPRYTLQYKTDAPLNIRALFYIPAYKPSLFDLSQEGDIGVSLYSKKVLILSKANKILPRWLRFVKGVVDSEDIPLNLSRELLQDSNLIRKLKQVLTQRIIRFLNEQAKLDPKKFNDFYEDYKMYFKEAIARSNEQQEKEDIAAFLRFESNKTGPKEIVSLSEYVKRMKPEQKNIYYFAAPTREIAMNSAYFEAIKQKDYEVVFLFEPHDEVVVLQLNEFMKKKLVSIEQEIETEKDKDDLIIEGDSRSLNNDQANELKSWLKNALSSKVKNIKINTKLESHPCIVTTSDMGAIRHFIKTNILQRDKVQSLFSMISLNMEINPKSSLIKSLYNLHKTDEPLAKLLAEQLLDNSLLNAGLVDDPRVVLSNLNQLLEKAFEKVK